MALAPESQVDEISKPPKSPLRLHLNALCRTIAFGALACGCAGCSPRDGDPVHYVLPNGYRGAFRIVFDGTDGGGYRHDGEKHIYSIPRTGVLHVTDIAPLEQFHRVSAAYQDGAIIYSTTGTPPRNPTDVRIEYLGTTTEDTWTAVGDQAEIEAIEAEWSRRGPRGLHLPASRN